MQRHPSPGAAPYPDGSPPLSSILACAPNLRAQVELCQPEWVLVLGAVALKVTLPRGHDPSA